MGKITQNPTNTNVHEVWQGTHCFDAMETVLKEYSGQYSILIWIHILTGNEILCKIYFKRLFSRNVQVFIDLFYRYHYPLYFIYSDCMWRHVCAICNSLLFIQSTEKNLFFFNSFLLLTILLLEKIRGGPGGGWRRGAVIHNKIWI